MISYCLCQTKKETEKVTKPWVMICCYSEPVAWCNAESFAPGVTGTVDQPLGDGTEVDPPGVTGTVVHPLGDGTEVDTPVAGVAIRLPRAW